MVWCVLVGEAMEDKALSSLPSIGTALKTAQSRRSEFGKQPKKQPAKSKQLQAPKKTKTELDRKPPKIKSKK